jgi:hypothetical protein
VEIEVKAGGWVEITARCTRPGEGWPIRDWEKRRPDARWIAKHIQKAITFLSERAAAEKEAAYRVDAVTEAMLLLDEGV